MWTWIRPIVKIGFTGVVKIGSCAISAVVLKDNNKDIHAVVIANAGDCRCVMGRNGRGVALSRVHNANDDKERAKIRAAHPNEKDVVQCQRAWRNKKTGQISASSQLLVKDWEQAEVSCYIKGCLQPSRTFGDFYLKYPEASYDKELNTPFFRGIQNPAAFPYVTAEPEIEIVKVTKKDDFIVLGSDGLWDYLSDEEIAKIVYEDWNKDVNLAQSLQDAVIDKAAKESKLTPKQLRNLPAGNIRRRLHDDCTIIVVRLEK